MQNKCISLVDFFKSPIYVTQEVGGILKLLSQFIIHKVDGNSLSDMSLFVSLKKSTIEFVSRRIESWEF